MPRKVKYALDYEDDYDSYDDYPDYEYEQEVDGDGYGQNTEGDNMASQLDKNVPKHAVWLCPICSYDNAETSCVCNICGAIQVYAPNHGKGKVNSASKDSGASGLVKSCAQMSMEEPKNSKLLGDFQRRKTSLHEKFDKKQPQSTRAKFSRKGKEAVVVSSTDNIMLGSSTKLSGAYGHNEIDRTQPASIRANFSRKGKEVVISTDNIMLDPSAQLSEANGSNESMSDYSRLSEDTSAALSKLDKKAIHNRKANSEAHYQPEEWMLLDKESESLKQLNLAIVGHVDSGKSTLSGRLLHLLGKVSKKEMHKYEKESKEKGKGSFAYAWAMDESSEERERGVTMTVAVAYFDSNKYRVVLLDSPGHKDFVPNMISGATQADAAILVVDASIGSFEAGMDGHGFGQTREHSQLVRSFGVEQIIVAINKMDAVEYSKERFDFIKSQLGAFLRSCGFKDSSIMWIPLSVMENQNLVASTKNVHLSSWYRGPCLLDAIDSLQIPTRDFSKPLVLPICDVIKTSTGQIAACGKLESGAIRNGSKVLAMPPGELATVRSIERDSVACKSARAGDHVVVILQGIEHGHVFSGGVLCHPDHALPVSTLLELRIVVLDITTPILIGSQVEFHIHHAKVSGRVAKIVALLDQKTGTVSKKTPRILKAKQSAAIEVELDGAVCVEEFSKCRALGRAFLRSSGTTIAVGIVTRVLDRR